MPKKVLNTYWITVSNNFMPNKSVGKNLIYPLLMTYRFWCLVLITSLWSLFIQNTQGTAVFHFLTSPWILKLITSLGSFGLNDYKGSIKCMECCKMHVLISRYVFLSTFSWVINNSNIQTSYKYLFFRYQKLIAIPKKEKNSSIFKATLKYMAWSLNTPQGQMYR